MSTVTPQLDLTPEERAALQARSAAGRAAINAKKKLTSPWASFVAVVLAFLWTVPTFGLLVTSFRPELAIKTSGWWTFFANPETTLDNYKAVLSTEGSSGLGAYFVNSFVIVIPAVIIPICLAILAAYAFAWIDFRGRNALFVAVFALQIVPIQVTLIPLLTLYVDAGLAGTFWTIWLSHSIFALPLAIFILHNFMKEIPKELIEAARMDGAGHVKILFRVLLPLMKPAIAAFGIFQFLWVWNDLLVALTFAGGGTAVAPITVGLANLSGTRDTAWHLLSAGSFVAIIVPVVVFIALQRYFVRGLLAGGLKG
ncbi:carbohydrate ABC transporter permease [Pengzhenrongella frigida]|uniref:Carbohydrate ABC transporter permease n=1 Tax=Pengzhenrongella frigida TaxID=1259133 RepID=A0A4Q5N0C4_9MICO|nr:carbohydrate ABC transporter permease [Cellulomonas sp. HLT2-17]RYV51592.1 carbohydrate ABC transporter permease [Cellulomonas sp. HLT2-17]